MTARCAIALTTAVLLSSGVEAQFNRGMMRESVEVTLFPIQKPESLLPSGTYQVELKNASPAPARIIEALESGIRRQLAENDSRLRESPQPGVVITATVTEWTHRRGRGTKYVSEMRQIGTKQVKDSKGKVKTEPVYEYGHNERTVTNEGTISIRLEVRHVASEAVLNDLTTRVTYFDETLGTLSPPTDASVADAMVDRAVADAAGKLSPGRVSTRVLMGRSDEVEPFNNLARDRKWRELAAALQQLPPHRDARRDAYRLHNLGVAHEALAYESTDRATVRAELQEATTLLARAVAAKKDEKYFVEAANRVALSLQAVKWITEREMALAAQFPVKPTPAARPAAAAASPAKANPAKPVKADERMTNADVIELKQAGLDDKLLIATIREAGSVSFDLGPAALRTLLGAKVSNPVITAMRERAKATPKPQR